MDRPEQERPRWLGRRAFVRHGALLLAGSAALAQRVAGLAAPADTDAKPKVRIGLVTDLHYADRAPAGTRYYRESPAKLAEAASRFEQEKPDLVFELGDLIDAADSLEAEKGYLQRISGQFAATPGEHHYVLGNHCVYNLSKGEFLEIVGQKRSYYATDFGGYHFIVLDACFRSDGQPYGRKNSDWRDANLLPAEVQWLRADLAQTSHKAVVFVHQRLDVKPPYGVHNALEVRKVLEDSGKVLAVVQGHYHPGALSELGGIHYCSLTAMVEGTPEQGNAYALMDILPGDLIRIRGFRKQASATLVCPPVSPPRSQTSRPASGMGAG